MFFKCKAIVFLLMLGSIACYAQQAVINLKGVVKDEITKSGIGAATATLYVGPDSTILKYAFTNNSGGFRFDGLPLDTAIILSITHLGYQGFTKSFRLSKQKLFIDLGEILLSNKTNMLKEVSIVGQRPPMTMRGDTLEINAEAFKTKENAVVEDLLRKVPGIIVWADGKITVNGKNVSQLYVEGKPFFGGDPVIAMRNLPKDAVDKVKVYDDKKSADPFEVNPQVIMDVSLKKNMKTGFFGKAGGAKGTDQRYEGNLALNYFSPKDQISVLGAVNNTNKQVFDSRSMLRQTVYKPGGNDNTSYQSNFGMSGLNEFKAGGVSYDRDWSKTTNTKGEYFNYNTQNETERNTDDITTLNNDVRKQHSATNTNYSRQDQQARGTLKSTTKHYELTVSPVFELQNNSSSNNSIIEVSNTNNQLLNSSASMFKTTRDEKRLNFSSEFISLNPETFNQNVDLKYDFTSNNYNGDELAKNTFDIISGSAAPKARNSINRQKNVSGTTFNQSLYSKFSLTRLFGYLGSLNVDFTNTITNNRDNGNQVVNKFDTLASRYSIIDQYLTNNNTYNYFFESPGLEISYAKRIVGVRNVKQLAFSVQSDLQIVNQNNHSAKAFQQFNRNYVNPVPSFYFRFNHTKEGLFNKLYTIRYKADMDVPTINQLVPLVDSAYQTYYYLGNNKLKQQYNHEITFSYQNSLPNNRGVFKLNIIAGATKNKFADSSIYDAAGRRISYPVNINGYKYITASMSFQKSGKLFSHPYGIYVSPRVNLSNSPYYINNQLNTSRNLTGSLLWVANYVENDLLLYDLVGTVNFSRNTQNRVNSSYTLQSVSASTGGSIQLSWPKHTTVVNNLTYDVNSNSYVKTTGYFIWNASINYRMLKKEQLELKLSASDLLKQRTNLIRIINNNTISVGSVNNLQQFFMIGLSYYPRQFGSGKK